MSFDTGGGGMSEQLINLHPPAECLAGSGCWTRPWSVGAGGIGHWDWKKGLVLARKDRSRTSQTSGLKACQENICNPATSQKEHKIVIVFSALYSLIHFRWEAARWCCHTLCALCGKKCTVTHLANWKMSKTNFSILIPFGLSGLISWPFASTCGIFFWATWCCSCGSCFLEYKQRQRARQMLIYCRTLT